MSASSARKTVAHRNRLHRLFRYLTQHRRGVEADLGSFRRGERRVRRRPVEPHDIMERRLKIRISDGLDHNAIDTRQDPLHRRSAFHPDDRPDPHRRIECRPKMKLVRRAGSSLRRDDATERLERRVRLTHFLSRLSRPRFDLGRRHASLAVVSVHSPLPFFPLHFLRPRQRRSRSVEGFSCDTVPAARLVLQRPRSNVEPSHDGAQHLLAIPDAIRHRVPLGIGERKRHSLSQDPSRNVVRALARRAGISDGALDSHEPPRRLPAFGIAEAQVPAPDRRPPTRRDQEDASCAPLPSALRGAARPPHRHTVHGDAARRRRSSLK